ncbi:hypothetical protein HQ533_02105 [Candidatus Woesearchaeota archaeon]|nr:hypothetical protein [Candidatus Woesearchaeota archaeon]
MATFLDIGIIEHFSIVFVFLLIFTVIYALLEYSKPFGKGKKGLHGIIALVLGLLIVISKPAVLLVNFLTSWFLVLFLFLFLVIFTLRMFGTSESDMTALVKDVRFYPWLVVIIVVIVIAGFGSVFGQTLLERGAGLDDEDVEEGVVLPGDLEGGSTRTTSFGTNVLNTVFHPKVLGLIAILLVGLFSITFLSKLT